MNISKRQHELLAEIQSLAISAGVQTGRRVIHEAYSWPDGAIWSGIRVMSDENYEAMNESTVTVSPNGEQRATFIDGPASLIEQRDRLADWIAANRKQEAA